MSSALLDQVTAIIREVGTAEVLSRFQLLQAGEVDEKSPGDFVTIADRECERVLGARLREICDVVVIGEEAVAADPSVRDGLARADQAWVIDPIDGTSNFIDGKPDFGVMVALVENGRPTHGWVWHPTSDTMLHTEPGAPTQRDGVTIEPPPLRSVPHGIVKRRYMAEPAKAALAEWPADLAELVPGRRCAAVEYAMLIDGEIDFIFYWRTLPWDHAPTTVLAEGAGCRSGRLDGSPYLPGDDQSGLLTARPDVWQRIADHINARLG